MRAHFFDLPEGVTVYLGPSSIWFLHNRTMCGPAPRSASPCRLAQVGHVYPLDRGCIVVVAFCWVFKRGWPQDSSEVGTAQWHFLCKYQSHAQSCRSHARALATGLAHQDRVLITTELLIRFQQKLDEMLLVNWIPLNMDERFK